MSPLVNILPMQLLTGCAEMLWIAAQTGRCSYRH
jgi:hypothetical protein